MAKVERMSIELTQQNTQKAFALCAFQYKEEHNKHLIYYSFLDFFETLDSM